MIRALSYLVDIVPRLLQILGWDSEKCISEAVENDTILKLDKNLRFTDQFYD